MADRKGAMFQKFERHLAYFGTNKSGREASEDSNFINLTSQPLKTPAEFINGAKLGAFDK